MTRQDALNRIAELEKELANYRQQIAHWEATDRPVQIMARYRIEKLGYDIVVKFEDGTEKYLIPYDRT